ncbi:MAG: ester cyclase [Planctomycetes bacterium]|jgi:predicted ester cyclase|nr:ester cyclase [Planctomycetota bacterium]
MAEAPEASLREHNMLMVQRFITLVMERGLIDFCDELLHPDVSFVDPSMPVNVPVDRKGIQMAVAAIHECFSGYTLRMDDIFPVGNDIVVNRFTGHATHKGGFFGSQLTNKPISWTGNTIYRFKDGRIHRVWLQWDLLATLVQLGLVQAPIATTPPSWVVPPVPGTPFVASDRRVKRITGVVASVAENIATVRRLFAGIMDEPIESLIEHCIAPDYQRHDNCALDGAPGNVDGFVRYIKAARECFHTYSMDLEEIMGEGDRVVCRVRAHGLHRGGFLGIAAGGQQLDFSLTIIYRLDGARIAHSWVTWDVYRALSQLGALPPAPASLS